MVQIFDPPTFRLRASLILAVLVVANIVACAAAVRVTGAFPILLGSAVLAYGLGLRHAFDADHIAAIDNVTRRMVAGGASPAGVGFFFSLGHSSVVVAATIGVALAASRFKQTLIGLQDVLGPVSTLASSLFLLIVAGLNILVFAGVWRALRQQRGQDHGEPGQDVGVEMGGMFSRRLEGLVRRISRSWLMYPLGILFGLGFDTATEVGLLGLTAAQAAKGLPLWSILIFPALFASGMALADTLEGLLMVGAYRWTGTRPRTRLFYNLAVTAASIVAGLAIAAMQLLSLAPKAIAGFHPLTAASLLARHSEWVGGFLVMAFAGLWSGWVLADRARGRPVASQ